MVTSASCYVSQKTLKDWWYTWVRFGEKHLLSRTSTNIWVFIFNSRWLLYFTSIGTLYVAHFIDKHIKCAFYTIVSNPTVWGNAWQQLLARFYLSTEKTITILHLCCIPKVPRILIARVNTANFLRERRPVSKTYRMSFVSSKSDLCSTLPIQSYMQ